MLLSLTVAISECFVNYWSKNLDKLIYAVLYVYYIMYTCIIFELCNIVLIRAGWYDQNYISWYESLFHGNDVFQDKVFYKVSHSRKCTKGLYLINKLEYLIFFLLLEI